MAFRTANEITQDVISLVGLVTGTGVQTYTEPQVLAAIQAQFDILFQKRFWDWLTDTTTFALDGVTGIATSNLSTVLSDPNDVEYIYVNGTDQRVVPPVDREHVRLQSGSRPLYYTPLPWTNALAATRMLKFWPITATDSVDIRCRTKPARFTMNATVPFPDVIMTQAAAWHLLDNDGINPTASQKCQLLFETSYRDLINSGDDAIGHGGGRLRAPITIRTL